MKIIYQFVFGMVVVGFLVVCNRQQTVTHKTVTHKTVTHKTHTEKQINGKVVGVTDGDTITVLDHQNQQHKIRLAEIDTPEKKQAFGSKCKEVLSDKVFGKNVKVLWDKEDRYKRIIGSVYLGDRYINKEMIEEGYAWHYKQYSKSKEFSELEEHARNKKLGLWVDKNPIPPWDFRSKKGK